MTTIIIGYDAVGVANRSVIGIDNVFRSSDATVTVSSEDADFPKENAYDDVPYTAWKPTAGGDSWIRASFTSAVPCDYIGIHRHNLSEVSGTLKVEYSNLPSPGDGTPGDWTEAQSTVTITEDRTVCLLFDQQTALHWRVYFTSSSAQSIGVINIGSRLTLPGGPGPGWVAPLLGERAIFEANYTHDGNPAPRSVIRKSSDIRLVIEFVDDTWIRDNWIDFREQAAENNFFLLWAPVSYPDEAAFMWPEGDIAVVPYSDPFHQTIAVDGKASVR